MSSLRKLSLSLEVIYQALILGFIILLIMAAVFLAIGDEGSANLLAEYAYYLLVAGVVFALIDIVKNRDAGNNDEE